MGAAGARAPGEVPTSRGPRKWSPNTSTEGGSAWGEALFSPSLCSHRPCHRSGLAVGVGRGQSGSAAGLSSVSCKGAEASRFEVQPCLYLQDVTPGPFLPLRHVYSPQ